MNAARWVLIAALVVALGMAGQVAFADKVAPSSSGNTGADPDPPGNLLLNNSFQTGDFTDWNLSGNAGFTSVTSGAFYVYPRSEDADGFYAVLGAIGSDAVISQTVSDSSGQAYTVSFWYDADGSGPSDFSASWDGVALLSLTNPVTSGWTLFSFDVTGTGSDTLSFGARNDPAYDALDNVAVFATAPEPDTLLLLGLGLTALIGISRRRLRA